MPQTLEGPYVREGLNLRLVARRQRWLLWMVLALLASMALPFMAGAAARTFGSGASIFVLFGVLAIVLRLSVWVATILLMRALRTNVVILVLCVIFMLAPFLNLIILLLENRRATRALRKAGVHVGLMGVRDEVVVTTLSENLCHTCGYNLTGNVSGRCPECGTLIEEARLGIVQPVLPDRAYN